MAKSPVSILQEYAMANGLPLPTYHIVSQGDSFKCIVTIGNVTQDAQAANKKRAKHNAAEKVVTLLTEEGMIDSTKNIKDNPPPAESPLITNSVGELNEFCSRTGIAYPIYDFNVNSVGLTNEFVCKCELDCYKTEGTGISKKEAKQVAAKRMLDIATSSNNNTWKIRTRSPPPLSPKQISDSAPPDNQTIIELFKKLSFRNRARRNDCTPQADLPKKILTKAEIDKLFENEAHDEPFLKNLLANLGIKCTISAFQANPLVMCVTTQSSDYPTFTFLQDGVSRHEIVVKLLKKVVDAIAVHIYN